MKSDAFFNLLIMLWPLGYVKIFILILIVFYIVFSLICFRQVKLMNNMVEAQISPLLKLISLIHLGVAVAVFFWALVLL